MNRDENKRLAWQSKAILLIVVPWTVISVATQGYFWAIHEPQVAWTTLGISTIFGLIVWKMRAGTPAAAATGAAITASLMFSTTRFPYEWSWLHGGLMPLLAVFLLTYAATKIGRAKKEQLGTGESKHGRNAAQVAANLGVAGLIAHLVNAQPFFGDTYHSPYFSLMLLTLALAEAAADTVSSEIGQVLGGQPRLITTFRKVEPGTDGGITLAGTVAGVLAATLTASVAVICANSGRPCPTGVSGCDVTNSGVGDQTLAIIAIAVGASIGLVFDSLLGATAERKGWLNNDAVNFLSTLIAPWAFMLVPAFIFWLTFR